MCPWKVRSSLPVLTSVTEDALVVAAGCECLSVGAVGHAGDSLGVALELLPLGLGQVVDLGEVVGAAGGERLGVGAKGDLVGGMPVCGCMVSRISRLLFFQPQMYARLSPLTAPMRLPSRLKATEWTICVALGSSTVFLPVARSHKRTILSAPPEARSLPLGWKATVITLSMCSVSATCPFPVAAFQTRTAGRRRPRQSVCCRD